jgi:hypothetical protein
MSKGFGAGWFQVTGCMVLAYVVAYMTVAAGVGYVIFHFVSKWW